MPSSPFPTASRTQQKSWARLLQSKYRVREGRFLAEGVKVVEELIQSGWPIEAVIVRTDKEPYWSRLPLPERIPVYQLSQADFKRLSQDKEPEGVIAVTHIKKPPEIQSIRKRPAVVSWSRMKCPIPKIWARSSGPPDGLALPD